MTLFDKCVSVVLLHEGGYQNDPNDTGNYVDGELRGTKYGIAARYFPDVDIPNLTIEEAKQIYWQYFWLPMNLEGIENELAVLHIFDHGVNAGRTRAVKMAQELVGAKPDGLCGPLTRLAINSYKGDFVADYKQARIEYYTEIANRGRNMKFFKGWINRVNSTHF